MAKRTRKKTTKKTTRQRRPQPPAAGRKPLAPPSPPQPPAKATSTVLIAPQAAGERLTLSEAPPRELGKYKVLGEDHLQGSVRLVLARRSDNRIFIVDETAFVDQQGYGVPHEIHERLKR
jgi:hypothetical protein